MRKNFTLGSGKYYFSINTGHSKIMIHRSRKEDAVQRFLTYKRIGKDCEWLGCWNGKSFDENTPPKN